MYFVRLDDDRSHRAYGTDRFAAATTDAKIGVYLRDGQRALVRNHMHGLGRAVLRTSPAIRPLRLYDTTVDEEGGDAHLCSRFLFLGKRLYSVRGANLRADRAFVIAITVDVSDTGFQHIIKAILQSRGT